MRVLHIITGLSTGGAEMALLKLLSMSDPKKFDCAVISLTDEGTIGERIAALGYPVITLNIKGILPSPKALRRLCSFARQFKPDIIQGWMYHGNMVATLTSMLSPGAAVVWNVRHSLYDLKLEKFGTRQIIRINRMLSYLADSIIFNSFVSRNQHKAFGFFNSRSLVVPNGFNCDLLGPDSNIRYMVRQSLGFSEDLIIVGHVARFHPMKDHASFLRAAVSIAKTRPNVRFLVVGRDVSRDNPSLKDIVPPRFLDRFFFTGQRDDVEDLMRAMDIFCLSSSSEAFPNVLGEAMATGLACLTTDVGDSAAILGESGLVVPPNDSELLAEGLISLMDMELGARNQLGVYARHRVQELYSLGTVVDQYQKLYEKLIRGRD